MLNNNSKSCSIMVCFSSAEEKEKIKEAAKSFGLSMSSFIRLAAEEYIRQHPWDKNNC